MAYGRGIYYGVSFVANTNTIPYSFLSTSFTFKIDSVKYKNFSK
ncbi:hypothetical protein CTDIVETGP_0502 [Clostridium tyrobutyricum DIVETGP]|uniref:Uncharacterized protein n=1 Tax=Clostridium tyrobutyricum DIVETGP TaxID=1408889 RepID=W6NEG5_CLOTY|nr:hypothetical protein CTK_C16030 [Clostridium tyrobutyricum]CDL90432.1 hypothetical protein CTDIVETGP_0502 [Clostridium tyrobutyricum DIVETGP]